MKYEDIEIFRINHDAFKIKGNKTVYIDPFKIQAFDKADFVLISHNHYDHLSIDDIKKVIAKNTILIASPNCEKLKDFKENKIVFLNPGEKFQDIIKVEAVHAYNINKNFHPRSYNGVGFVLEIDSKRIYHAGDTDFIPEMKNLKNIDVALLPVSGTYVMTPEEAVQAANLIKPKLAIPMHYGSIVGTEKDALKFKELYKGNCETI
ncbi:MBL fold metallo-hydrolase [Candidatus Woesearchaeota archaeon]|nr:MBL fold metallo-hydrolase [Candidatus Woesearchaeota archaeon]